MAVFLENLYRHVFLVFPHGITQRERFCDLIAYIANLIPATFAVNLIVANRANFDRYHRHQLTRDVELIELVLSDIWLGDYFPYRIDEENVFSFRYPENPTDQRRLLAAIEFEVDEVPLQLDFGSFEMIGEVLLVSTDIYDLNRHSYDVDDVNAYLHDYFEPASIVVIESPTRLTHLDTMFRVFDDIVLYNSKHVPPTLLRRVQAATRRYGYSFHDLPFTLSGEVNEAHEGHVESYVGNVFDFLVLDSFVLFPIVLPSDEGSLVRLQQILSKSKRHKTVVPLRHPDLEELYRLGGGLFCICGIC